ncbi:hypothetical protein C8R44DRAFT_738148 [Mycena epipterygia]|nr:hypothetical protein C8R44DRAFT_738148 [Mycena epipterygia]
MDVSATRRFLTTNVTWPQDKKFFLPEGGLVRFLETNLRFKATETVKLLTTPQLGEIRMRMKDLVQHMFYAAQIRQNKFRVTYEPGPIPAEAAWMFHVILTLLTVVGSDGDNKPSAGQETSAHSDPTEGHVAHAQAAFFLGGALQTFIDDVGWGATAYLDYHEYDEHRWVSKNFAYWSRPTDFIPVEVDDLAGDVLELNRVVADWHEKEGTLHPGEATTDRPVEGEAMCIENAVEAINLAVTAGVVKRTVLKCSPIRRSLRVLAAKIDEMGWSSIADGARFFLDEEERARSEASSGSMPDLASVSANEDSDMGVFEIVKTACTILDGGPGIGARGTINRIADSNIICTRKFLQQCLTGSAGSEGPVLDLPPSKLEEIQFHLVILLGTIAIFAPPQRLLGRARFWVLRRVRSSNRGAATVLEDVKFYAVPPHACEMFAILLHLIVMSRLEQEHPIPVAVARPIVLDFLLTANAVATATQGPRDFPEYNADGLLGEVASAFVFPPLD